MSDKHPIDEHFKAHLTDQEVQPSRDLWADLEPRLQERPRKRGWFIGVAASVTIAFAVSTFIYDTYQPVDGIQDLPVTTDEPSNEIPTNTTPSKETPAEEELTPSNESVDFIAIDEEESTPAESPIANRIPEVVGQDAGKSARRHTALNNDAETRVEPREFAEMTREEMAPAERPQVSTSVSIDPNRYRNKANRSADVAEVTPSETPANEQTEPEKMALGQYAGQQFNRLIHGEEMVLPKKEEIKWPSLQMNLGPLLQKFTPAQEPTATDN